MRPTNFYNNLAQRSKDFEQSRPSAGRGRRAPAKASPKPQAQVDDFTIKSYEDGDYII